MQRCVPQDLVDRYERARWVCVQSGLRDVGLGARCRTAIWRESSIVGDRRSELVNLHGLRSKARHPAVRRDPARMLIRPLLRHLESAMSRHQSQRLVWRAVGLGGTVEYSVSEILDRSRYLYGSYEYVYASAFVGQILPGSVVVDVGANIGEYTLLAALSTGATGRVVAVEPNVALHPRLVRNLDLNDATNVEVWPVALGSVAGSGTLTVPMSNPALGTLRGDSSEEPKAQYEVPIKRLDDALPPADRQRLSVLKIDVEGWELDVLRGARETLAEAKPVVLYECGAEQFAFLSGRRLTSSMAFLETLGYRNHTVRMDGRGRWKLVPIEETQDPLASREPWTVLMVVAVHPEATRDAVMSGQTKLPRCGLFDLLGRSSTAASRYPLT